MTRWLLIVAAATAACSEPPPAPDAALPTRDGSSATAKVEGVAVDVAYHPVRGARVVIEGVGDTVTDDNGRFQLEGVRPPFDLAAIVESETVKTVVQYRGVTRLDPVVMIRDGSGEPFVGEHVAALSGTVSPGFPAASGDKARVSIRLDGITFTAAVDGPDGSYMFDELTWDGPATITAEVHALRWRDNPRGFPAEYTGYGSTLVTLDDGGRADGSNISTTELDTVPIAAAITVPEGFPLPGVAAYAVAPDGAWISVGGMDVADLTTVAPTSAITIALRARTLSVDGARAIAEVNPVEDGDLVLPAPPVLLAPADLASDISTETVFTWRPGGPDNAYMLNAVPVEDGWRVHVITSAPNSTLPNLSDFGVELSGEIDYEWYVTEYSARSVDEIADAGFVRGLTTDFATYTEADSARRNVRTER